MPADTPTAPHPVRAFVGLGANLGDARQTVGAAARELLRQDGVQRLRLSPVYRTAPVDSSGPDYVNAVAELYTTLEPQALLQAMQGIERAHGRTRPWRNAPRTLDLDLLWYDDRTIAQPELSVPHPRMHQRAFVLRPLADLAPGLSLAQGPLSALLQACADQAIEPLPDATPWLRLVVAYSTNHVIGRDGGLPWHLPGDMAHFKRFTWGQPVLMGRRTWESLGRALPGRRNLVLSRNADFRAEGAECHTSLEAALATCGQAAWVSVIGGAHLFLRSLPIADELIATEIGQVVEGDTYFPVPVASQWQETERRAQTPEDGLPYDFVTYQRQPDEPTSTD